MKRLLSIITAFALCLTLFPTWAFAAENGDDWDTGFYDADAGYEPEPDAGPEVFQMERASAADINMEYNNFVFAQGVPIVIKQNGSITSIYDTESNLLSGDVDVSTCAVYGGWYDTSEHKNSTSIVMESGTVAVLYGGSCFGELTGNTSVVVNGGTVGWVYGGGNNSTVSGTAYVTINSGAKIWGNSCDSGSIPEFYEKGTIFGGGIEGSVANTEVVFNGGDMGGLYGGGQNCTCTNTRVKFLGQSDDYTQIYAGGYGGQIGTATLEFYGTGSSKNNAGIDIFGGGCNDSVDKVEIIIGSESEPGSVVFYAKWPYGESTVGSASFDLSLKGVTADNGGDYVLPQVNDLSGEGVIGDVSVYIHGGLEGGQPYGTNLSGIKEVIVENCRFIPRSVDTSNVAAPVNLDRLEIRDSGEVVFNAGSTVNIGELAGSGTIQFINEDVWAPNEFYVTVNKITVPEGSRIKISRRGAYIDNAWENSALLKGPGVETLESASCFASNVKGYIIVKSEDGSEIRTAEGNELIETAISPTPHFEKPTYEYGETMTITMGLMTFQGNSAIPGQELEILGGSMGNLTVASVTTDADGKTAVDLPVNDVIWASRGRGLSAIFHSTEEYKESFYGISLKDGDGGMSYIVTPANIALSDDITAPAIGETPNSAFAVDENAFYTAEVVWSPADAVFQYNTAYAASIRLTPKAGYSLDSEKINSISYQGNSLAVPGSTEPDGSLILTNVKTFDAVPGFRVNLTISPAEGGSASGGGIFGSGQHVTIQAAAAEGYFFDGWKENGEIVSTDPEYTFAVMEDRNLTACFHIHDWSLWESAGEEQHSRSCTVCGIEETGAHEYDGDTDTSCNICAYEKTLPPDSVETKIEQSELGEVPEGLNGTAFDTVEKIKDELSRVLIAQADYTSENTAFYDVKLMVSTDGGDTWVPATEENFPEGGLTITLPYPDGTGQTTHDFVVTHMFTSSGDGWQPGDTENPSVTKLENEIQFTVRGLSPIAVAWKAVAGEPEPTPTPEPTPAPEPAPAPTPAIDSNFGPGFTWNAISAYSVIVRQPEHGSVIVNRTSAANGDAVILTVVPDEGYVLDALTVTQSQGSELKLTDLGGGKYAFTMPGRDVIVTASFVPVPEDVQPPCSGGPDCPSQGFTDLGDMEVWYHEAVDYVLRNGLMNGIGGGLFGPENLLTRAQFAQILYNEAGQPAVTGGSGFADVVPDRWYAPAVTWAARCGFVNGYGNGLFGPDDNITREQLAVMFWRYAGSPSAADKELRFTDADMASVWALDALCWAAESGILNGRSGGLLDPKGYATRAETAQMLQNYLAR